MTSCSFNMSVNFLLNIIAVLDMDIFISLHIMCLQLDQGWWDLTKFGHHAYFRLLSGIVKN